MIVFLRLARKWPRLMNEWAKVDEIMERNYGYPRSLDKRLRLTAAVIMALSTLEYCLSVGSHMSQCKNELGVLNASNYYTERFPSFFFQTGYGVALAVFTQAVSVMATFTWNFNDLFIVLVSSAMALRFRQVAARLEQFEKMVSGGKVGAGGERWF